MSAVRVDRGPNLNPWLFHVETVEEVDEFLTSSQVRQLRELTDQLLDLRNEFRALEAPA